MVQEFTHMKPDEIRIWNKWLTATVSDPKDFIYDVRVGPGAPIPAGTTPAMIRQIKALTQHRIDALGVINGVSHIFEVKKDAGLSALGQLEGYEDLLKRDVANGRYTFPADTMKRLVYETAEADVIGVMNRKGVFTEKV